MAGVFGPGGPEAHAWFDQRSQAQAVLAPLGLQWFEIDRNGDCFFQALRVSAAAAGVDLTRAYLPGTVPEDLTVEVLRSLVADQALNPYWQQHARGFLPSWDTWEGYADWIRKSPNWEGDRGDLVLYLAAWAFGIRIQMVGPAIRRLSPETGTMTIGTGDAPAITLYRPDNVHWDATVPATPAGGHTGSWSQPGQHGD